MMIVRWLEFGNDRVPLRCVSDECEGVQRKLKGSLLGVEKRGRWGGRENEEEREEQKKWKKPERIFARKAGPGVAGMVLWCCVVREWRNAYCERAKDDVFRGDNDMDLVVDWF